MLTARKLEKITKGVANHRRIEIINLLYKTPDLSVIEISQRLKINFKTASEHIRRLAIAGLVYKRNQGSAVRHKLSPTGSAMLEFLKNIK